MKNMFKEFIYNTLMLLGVSEIVTIIWCILTLIFNNFSNMSDAIIIIIINLLSSILIWSYLVKRLSKK